MRKSKIEYKDDLPSEEFYNKEPLAPINTGKRKLTDLDFLEEEDSPLWKRSRLDDYDNSVQLTEGTQGLPSGRIDSVIFVNDVEEELDDSELDLGLYEEIPSF